MIWGRDIDGNAGPFSPGMRRCQSERASSSSGSEVSLCMSMQHARHSLNTGPCGQETSRRSPGCLSTDVHLSGPSGRSALHTSLPADSRHLPAGVHPQGEYVSLGASPACLQYVRHVSLCQGLEAPLPRAAKKALEDASSSMQQTASDGADRTSSLSSVCVLFSCQHCS